MANHLRDAVKGAESRNALLNTIHDALRRDTDAWDPVRERMLADVRFAANLTGTEQWEPQAVRDRQDDHRPRITIDRLSQPIYSIVNLHRQGGAGLQVIPVDQGADPDTAEVIQGLMRNIETQSRARLAYTWGVQGAATHGLGFLRVIAEHIADRSFDQDLRIKRVLNPFRVYPDCACEEPDFSDARRYTITQDLTVEEYRQEYTKDSDAASLDQFTGAGDTVPLWFPSGHVRVAEHYYVTTTPNTLILLRDNTGNPLAIFQTEIEIVRAKLAEMGRFIVSGTPEKERPVKVRQIKWAKINGLEVLQEREVPGKWIPIVPVVGEELFVDGQRDYRGIVRSAKEAAMVYNVEVTGLIEAVALIPKSPYIISAGQLKGFEEFWKNANIKNYAALPYNVVDVNGQLVPPPQRNPAAPALQPLVAAILQADNDVKAATRYFDASLGQAGPQESGRAITARQRQGDLANDHFLSNFRDITLSHLGRILIDQIPYYYDTARVARITGQDDQARTVVLNQPFKDEQGVERIYRMGFGTYDVVAQAGPGYATKQQETRELLTTVITAAPNVFPLIGDLAMKAMGLYDVAKRLEKTLPPELREEQPGQAPQLPPEHKQQMDLLLAQHQELTQQLAQAKELLATQREKLDSQERLTTLELESKERIVALQVGQDRDEALLKARTEIELLQAELEQKQAETTLKATLEELKLHMEAIKLQLEEKRLAQEREDRAADRG